MHDFGNLIFWKYNFNQNGESLECWVIFELLSFNAWGI